MLHCDCDSAGNGVETEVVAPLQCAIPDGWDLLACGRVAEAEPPGWDTFCCFV